MTNIQINATSTPIKKYISCTPQKSFIILLLSVGHTPTELITVLIASIITSFICQRTSHNWIIESVSFCACSSTQHNELRLIHILHVTVIDSFLLQNGIPHFLSIYVLMNVCWGFFSPILAISNMPTIKFI